MAEMMVRLDDRELAQGVPKEQASRATEVRRDRRADGKVIELHLTEDNAKRYDEERAAAFEAMAPWFDAGLVVPDGARRSGSRSKPSASASASTTDREENKAMREWLRTEGGATELADRGRPPGHLVEAFQNKDTAAVKRWNDARVAQREAREAREAG